MITDKAVLRPHGPANELHLSSVHPGHTADEVIENTGWELKTAPGMTETPAPGDAEMTALHQVDREGFWR